MHLSRPFLASSKYLTAGNPTGLTGLANHASPRAALLALYTQTLHRAHSLPAHCAYRTALEALTTHRLRIVERTRPAGWEAWAARTRALVAERPDAFCASAACVALEMRVVESGVGTAGGAGGAGGAAAAAAGELFVVRQERREPDSQLKERDLEAFFQGGEAGRSEEEMTAFLGRFRADQDVGGGGGLVGDTVWIEEPPLEVQQIEAIENEIGAGLIEEVIQVAEGELKLVDTMLESKVWESLEENAPDEQWTYFERGTHTAKTQAPPS